jgi:heptaprenyl diphosphate synthase
MDYKMLHGGGSRAASSPSTAQRGDPEAGPPSALPEGAFETVDEVEALLGGVGERAPAALAGPAHEALTSGGKRLRPLLLVLCARIGEPERGDLLRAATAIEVLHTATLIHDDIVDKAESRRGGPTTVARYGREAAIATGDYLFAEAFSELA